MKLLFLALVFFFFFTFSLKDERLWEFSWSATVLDHISIKFLSVKVLSAMAGWEVLNLSTGKTQTDRISECDSWKVELICQGKRPSLDSCDFICLSNNLRLLLIKSYSWNRWWRMACVDWWQHCHNWMSRDVRICFAAQMRCLTGCMRMRRGNSRLWLWRKPSLSCRRSWGTTGIASKSSSCRWHSHIDLADPCQQSATILSTALSTCLSPPGSWVDVVTMWKDHFSQERYEKELFLLIWKIVIRFLCLYCKQYWT